LFGGDFRDVWLPGLADLTLLTMSTGLNGGRLLLEFLNGPGPEIRERIEQFGEEDWRQLVASATKHGLHPWLYGRLISGSVPITVPAAILQGLRESYLMNGARNLLLYQDLARVLGALRQAEIPVIVLKGAHLAALVYRDSALRFVGDIDLLVTKAHTCRAAALLQQLGYRLAEELNEVWFNHRHAIHLPELINPPHPRIDLHWRIHSEQPAEGESRLWGRARPAKLGDTDALVLSPEDLVLHLCLHGGGLHLFALGLRLMWDLRATIDRYTGELDWHLLVDLGKAWRMENCLHLVLRMARELAGAPVPPPALEALQPTDDFEAHWLAMATERLLGGALEAPVSAPTASAPLRAMADLSTLRLDTAKYGSWWGALFPSRQYMAYYMMTRHALPLTPRRAYTCYLTRAMDWLGKGLYIAWYGVVHRQKAIRCFRNQRKKALLRQWLGSP
jgi:hypothetical protein